MHQHFIPSFRFAFAGGRDSQLPKVCSYLHIKYLTPIPAIILIVSIVDNSSPDDFNNIYKSFKMYTWFFFQTIVTIFFDVATFFDINALLNITGIIEELKILLAMVALVYLKFKRPDLKGTIQVTVYFIASVQIKFSFLNKKLVNCRYKKNGSFLPFQIPTVLVILSMICLVAMVVLAVYAGVFPTIQCASEAMQ